MCSLPQSAQNASKSLSVSSLKSSFSDSTKHIKEQHTYCLTYSECLRPGRTRSPTLPRSPQQYANGPPGRPDRRVQGLGFGVWGLGLFRLLLKVLLLGHFCLEVFLFFFRFSCWDVEEPTTSVSRSVGPRARRSVSGWPVRTAPPHPPHPTLPGILIRTKLARKNLMASTGALCWQRKGASQPATPTPARFCSSLTVIRSLCSQTS